MYVLGMSPDNLFTLRSKISKDWLKFPKHEGMLPLNLLNDNSSILSDLRLHRDGDISPVNELLEIVNLCRLAFFHNQLGIDVILLFDNLRISKSAISLINVGISTKLHESNCKI